MAAEINERLLTQDERSELALLRKAARGEATSSEWADAFGPSGSRKWVRRHPWTLVAALLYLGFVTFTVVMLVRLQPHWVYTVGVAAFVLILGGLPLEIGKEESHRWAKKQIPILLRRIGYQQRAEDRRIHRGTGGDGAAAPISNRQSRYAWYNENGPHSDLTWRDYELAHDIYGMSADEWEANRPD